MTNTVQNFDIDLSVGPQLRGNAILEDFNKVRELDPVFWSEKSQCWIISRFDDVVDGFNCKLPLLNAGRLEFVLANIPVEERADKIPSLNRYTPHWIVAVDGDQHVRLRKLMIKSFTRKVIEKIRPDAKARVNYLLDKAVESPEIEFNEEIARPLPGYVIFKLLGIPEEYFPALRDWANDTVEGTTAALPSPEVLQKADRALGSMSEMVFSEVEKRKLSPTDDLLTTLVEASDDGDKLTMDELLAAMQIMIVAGHDTTSNTMTLGLEALSRHPEAWQTMYENPENMLDYVIELMRYIAMTTGQTRLAGEDFMWHGKQIKKGQVIFLSIAGANRDPAVFSNPEKLDLNRDNTQSQVFAPGMHHCIGHLLAKMQLVEFFTAVVDRFEKVEVLDETLDFMPTAIFRGMYGMNVRFYPRA